MDTIRQETIYRALNGQATAEEEQEISRWYEEYPEECRRIIRDMHRLTDMSELCRLDELQKKDRRRNIRRNIMKTVLRAASVIILVAAGCYVSHLLTWDNIARRTTSVEAPFGEQVSITLPDSSTVRLNSGARLTYPAVFRKDCRVVNLTGEAMFEVVHSDTQPFIVKTFTSETRVYGTRFNLYADPSEKLFTASLLEGVISIKNLASNDQTEIMMQPNDVIRIHDGKVSRSRLSCPDELCWTEGMIYLDGIPFDEMMKKFEKAFNVNIDIKCSTLPDIKEVSGKIRINDGVVNALKILQHTVSFRFTKNEETNTVTIY